MKREKVICSVCRAKNMFPVMGNYLANEDEIYPEFCPNPRTVEESEVRDIVQTCEHCGYTYPRIDEETRMDKKKIRSDVYVFPFGPDYSDSPDALKCYRVALAARESKNTRMATRWFIMAGILMKPGADQTVCYKNALVLLRNQIKESQDKIDIQILLAYLNMLRLLKMFGSVKNAGAQEKFNYTKTDRELIEALLSLADREQSQYMTYFEMLQG